MQRTFYSRFAFAVFFAISLLGATPGHAQLAYTPVARNTEASSTADPEDEKPAAKPTYKLIHGVIQGEQGVLPGATVWLQGSKTIAVTNAEGEFELRVPSDAKVVRLACGYGGLQEEVVTLAPVQAMGSLYLLRVKGSAKR
ncbi:carboxypeptidase-like regulatory domain-containing protein [Hymenobacter armeniacus]|uniref:Carboxypeptidase-like regulatory domain-containing protein n=1 Tax=Hymenobacter armeniacus TaxID=2771358 RepID=A0ABR8JRA2_9BACT|nr:carboxypeptidase-like regulatory domain-containing protein [Hymenobacter armeniacus]MBD2721468.1 carboxypeptidase-like regulatory domain-containing protein [Hymenobacter armeniacus]